MNKSFLIIFIPALLVAGMYLAMGIHPPTRVEVGIAIVAAALGAYRVRWMIMKRGGNVPPPPSATAAPTQPTTQH